MVELCSCRGDGGAVSPDTERTRTSADRRGRACCHRPGPDPARAAKAIHAAGIGRQRLSSHQHSGIHHWLTYGIERGVPRSFTILVKGAGVEFAFDRPSLLHQSALTPSTSISFSSSILNTYLF